VTVGGGKGIGGIHEASHLFIGNVQQALQHTGHLLLRCAAVASQSHFDFHGSIFVDGYAALDGCGDGHPLGTSQFQHRLHILAEERSLDGQFVGQVGVDDAGHALKDVPQLQVGISELPQVDDSHRHHVCLSVSHFQHAIAHDVRSRVNAHDDLVHFCVQR